MEFEPLCVPWSVFCTMSIVQLFPYIEYKMKCYSDVLLMQIISVRIKHEDLVYPKPCKACGTEMTSMEEMKTHLESLEHKTKVMEAGWFGKTNPCAHCNLEFVT